MTVPALQYSLTDIFYLLTFAVEGYCSTEVTSTFKLYLHVASSVQRLRTSGIYRVSQEECTKLRESVPNVKLYRYNPKHLYLKLNGYGDNGQRSLKL